MFFSCIYFNKFQNLNFHFTQYIKIYNSTLLYLLTLPLTVVTKITINPWKFETLNPHSFYNKIHSDYYKKFGTYNIKFDYDFLMVKEFLKKKILSHIILFVLI